MNLLGGEDCCAFVGILQSIIYVKLDLKIEIVFLSGIRTRTPFRAGV